MQSGDDADTPQMNAPAALVELARETLAKSYDVDRHRTACALRTTSGAVHTGIHLDTTIGSASIHAEAAAIAAACEDAPADDALAVDCIAAVSYVPESRDAAVAREDILDGAAVIPPCGSCRELVSDYGPDADVVVSASPTVETRPIADLLPDAPWFGAWE
ncbi:hypothetical protein [Haloarchaeobius sp. DT45]|uniref:hypothetical protein n=1 Tax=Haloarchaeobius sp. DT45 TaxID=3446116 RepID=UPI003F6B2CC1